MFDLQAFSIQSGMDPFITIPAIPTGKTSHTVAVTTLHHPSALIHISESPGIDPVLDTLAFQILHGIQ